MSLPAIKQAIKTNLDALVTSQVLAGATTADIRKSPLDSDIATYPHAFLMPPSIESAVVDNRTITRSCAFDIMVLFQAEDIAGTEEIEEKVEAILSQFDNDPTLQGTAMAGMLPVSSAPTPFQHSGRDLIMVVVQITAKHLVTLTYS